MPFKKKLQVIEELFFRGIMLLATCIIGLLLLYIIYIILRKGLPSLSLEMLTQAPKGGYYFGKDGGILNAIMGSIYIASGSTFLSFITGLPIALYMNTSLYSQKKLVNIIRFILDLLLGVPSIVFGAFGFAVMIYFGIHSSLLAGIIVLWLLILPIMIRTIDEGLKMAPRGLCDATYSLGATQTELSFIVLFKQSLPAIITATLLSFGRAIGDAASVMFTAGFTDNIPMSLNQPAATLPLSIFFQLSSPIAEVKDRAYASALVLTLIILIISLSSRYFTNSYKKHSIKF